MSVADKARENAVHFECKKDGLQQRQSGDWVLRLTVAAVDMHQRITTAQMGTRFMCALVEINDDEQPVDHVAVERDKWRGLGPTKQAGIRCNDPVFWAWLMEEHGYPVSDEKTAAVAVRALCEVTSRTEFEKPGHSTNRALWYDLDTAFQAWRALENA